MSLMRIEIDKLCKAYTDEEINELYMYSCLKCSGFDEEQAYDLIGLLNELWLKDENDTSVSRLSDMLYDIYDDIKDEINELRTREILYKMYISRLNDDEGRFED